MSPVRRQWEVADGGLSRSTGDAESRLYPFEDHYLHGNPTLSFVYREIIIGLRTQYRCVALDYPGFRLSAAGPKSSRGSSIGFATATRQPQRFSRFVIGNTWA